MTHEGRCSAGAGLDAPRLRLDMKPDPESLPRLLGPKFDQLPFVVLVLGDLTRRDDPRPIEDRKPLGITRETFDKRMAEQKLAVEIAAPAASGGKATIRFRRLADFEPEALAQQLASMLPEDAVSAALASTFADPRVAALERTWRSIHLLVEQAGEHAMIEIVNASVPDLDLDFDDAPELPKCGLWKIVHQYNHLGMRPFSAIVLADDLGPHANHIRDIATIAQSGALVVLMDASDAFSFRGADAWAPSEAARFVARCAPPFVVAPAHAHRPRLEGRAAFVTAARMLRSHAATSTGCHFAAESFALPGVDLIPPDREEPEAQARSLAQLMLGNRIIHEALNVQWKRGLFPDRGAADCAARLNSGLATRLEGTGLIARVEPLPRDAKRPYAHPQELTVSLVAGGAPLLVRRFDLPDSA